MNTDGADFVVLKHFTYMTYGDGANPLSRLTLSGSVLYGATAHVGAVFRMNTDGTGFAVLRHFTGDSFASPYADLTLFGRVLYGITHSGGGSNLGTVFQMNIDGTGYLVLKNFSGGDGQYPFASLALSGSTLYGTTQSGGGSDMGTVFKLDLSNTPDFSLDIRSLGNAVVLTWSNPALTLQASPDLPAGFTTIPGATSPYTEAITGPQRRSKVRPHGSAGTRSSDSPHWNPLGRELASARSPPNAPGTARRTIDDE